MLDQVTGVEVLDLVDHPAPLTAHPAAAHVEDLHRGLERVLGEGDDVGAGEWLANVDGREKDDNGDAVLGALMGGECNGLGV